MIITFLIMAGVLIYDFMYDTPLLYEFTYQLTVPVWVIMLTALLAGIVDSVILPRIVDYIQLH